MGRKFYWAQEVVSNFSSSINFCCLYLPHKDPLSHAFSERILRHHALRGLMKPKASYFGSISRTFVFQIILQNEKTTPIYCLPTAIRRAIAR
jgi:hypothetical protein